MGLTSKKYLSGLFFILFILTACNSSETKLKVITAETAAQIAEKFLVEQGYADQKAEVSKKILLETNEFATDTSKILALRHNTINPKSVGVRSYEGEHGKSWVVGFNYVVPENNIVAGVAMDATGQHVRVQKSGVRYDWLVKSKE